MQEIVAAKTPVPVSLEVNTSVRQPLVFVGEARITMPCNMVPVYTPTSGSNGEVPS